jgi:enoyl-CoA hydratase
MTERNLANGRVIQASEGAVGFVTFNNPAKHNALSIEMWDGLAEALANHRDDPAIRVVILTGAGDAAFASGADISQFDAQRHDAASSETYSRRSAEARALLAAYPKPTIAAIRGFCLGGGLQVAMMADIRIAAETSRFGVPAARLGIAYGYDGLRVLVSLVGPAWARMLMFSGMRIDGAEALRIGLVERLVPFEKVAEAALEMARTISDNAPLSIRASKVTIDQILGDPADRDLALVGRLGAECMDSADFREGRRAFMEKRRPRFTGQ